MKQGFLLSRVAVLPEISGAVSHNNTLPHRSCIMDDQALGCLQE